jgi:hypothetical protein
MHNDEMVTTMMTNRIEILAINMSLPPKLSTPFLEERCLWSPNASANCSNGLACASPMLTASSPIPSFQPGLTEKSLSTVKTGRP